MIHTIHISTRSRLRWTFFFLTLRYVYVSRVSSERVPQKEEQSKSFHCILPLSCKYSTYVTSIHETRIPFSWSFRVRVATTVALQSSSEPGSKPSF